MRVLSRSYNYRLILLTATPMYDNSTEVFELANLLNVNNSRLQFPTGNNLLKQTDSGNSYLIKKRSNYINRSALKGDVYEITSWGKTQLENSLIGKVSYLRGNTETNPEKIELGEPLISENVGTTKVYLCEMSPYQYKVYINALKSDLGQFSKYDMSTAIKRIESEENVMESDNIISKASSLYKNSSDASTMTYPEFTYGKDGFSNTFSKSGSKYTINDKNVLNNDISMIDRNLNRRNEYSICIRS